MPHQQQSDYQYDPNEITVFAQTNFRGENRRFGIRTDDRRRHMYVIGKTGMGKSTMLENMIIQDIQTGKGVAVVDPHGDLVEKVLKFIPSHRLNDVIYFNPADADFPIAFNILESVDPELKNLVSNGLVGVFKKIWADSWGPRLEYILINAILALLEYPGSTLLGVTRMLVDAKYRKKVVRNITDPVVKSFWVDEFNNYSEKFRNEAIAPIQNKVGQFLSSSLIRNIVGQSKSTIDMREIMDSGKILLMNLSKGRVGEENAALLGAMMITKIQLAAMSRVDIPEDERRDFYLYVDEFQNFSTDSFANILSEARKYRLNLIMAHQYIEQLSESVEAAVFGNIGTLITFRVGATDAEELEKEYAPTFTQEDLVNLPAYHIYLRLMIGGVASEPFSAQTLPPISGETTHREKVIELSREHYARNRKQVEDIIRTWSGLGEDPIEEGTVQQHRVQPSAASAEQEKKQVTASVTPAAPSTSSSAWSKNNQATHTEHKQPPQAPLASAQQTQQAADGVDELVNKHLSFVSGGVAQPFHRIPEPEASVEVEHVEPKEQPVAMPVVTEPTPTVARTPAASPAVVPVSKPTPVVRPQASRGASAPKREQLQEPRPQPAVSRTAGITQPTIADPNGTAKRKRRRRKKKGSGGGAVQGASAPSRVGQSQPASSSASPASASAAAPQQVKPGQSIHLSSTDS